jgi:hypothetical protein
MPFSNALKLNNVKPPPNSFITQAPNSKEKPVKSISMPKTVHREITFWEYQVAKRCIVFMRKVLGNE